MRPSGWGVIHAWGIIPRFHRAAQLTESPNNTPPAKPPADEVALALRLAYPENLAPPEVLRSELRSFDKSAQLSPGKLGVNAAAKAAIRAGNYILATDNRGIAKDAIRDQLRMLDEAGRMTYDTRHQYLAGAAP